VARRRGRPLDRASDPRRRDRIALVGHSAGGLLTMSTALALRDERLHVSHHVLIEPTLGPALDTASRRELADGYWLSMEALDRCWALYLDAGTCPRSRGG
jgi:acetyl esterase/lipase